MSLKAKLEAVIYAAEEPVTLTQLVALFAADALEWKAEQEAAAAEAAEANSETLPMLGEGLEYLELSEPSAATETGEAAAEPTEIAADTGAETPAEAVAGPDAEAEATPEAAPESEPVEAALEPAAATPEDAEAEARRLARQRDREIKAILRQLLDEIMAEHAADDRGIEIREIAGGYRMATKPECHDAVRMFIKSLKPAMKLSLPALETLAVIAYKQPVTAPEVNEIRGVESGGVLGSLLSRKLITTAGRKQVIGRPILYKTTKEFLLRFGLKDLSELPSMEEFEKMAAVELIEPEAANETDTGFEPAPEAGAEPEFDEDAPEMPEETPAEEALADPAPESPSHEVETASTEAAPAEPPPTEQAETETPHHD